MKKICRGHGPLLLVILLLSQFAAGQAFAAELRFAWDPNTEADLAGYRIHYGKEPGVYTDAVDVGNPATIDGRVEAAITVPYGNKYFSCTAYTVDGAESDYSNEVMAVTPPDKPVNFNVVSASVTYYFAPK